jgi:hypothetical protein
MTTYQFNYVLQGIKRQIPIYKSLLSLNVESNIFYKSLTTTQQRILDEYRSLYSIRTSAAVYVNLKKHDIYFETLDTDLFDGQQNANAQYIELLGQHTNISHYQTL